MPAFAQLTQTPMPMPRPIARFVLFSTAPRNVSPVALVQWLGKNGFLDGNFDRQSLAAILKEGKVLKTSKNHFIIHLSTFRFGVENPAISGLPQFEDTFAAYRWVQENRISGHSEWFILHSLFYGGKMKDRETSTLNEALRFLNNSNAFSRTERVPLEGSPVFDSTSSAVNWLCDSGVNGEQLPVHIRQLAILGKIRGFRAADLEPFKSSVEYYKNNPWLHNFPLEMDDFQATWWLIKNRPNGINLHFLAYALYKAGKIPEDRATPYFFQVQFADYAIAHRATFNREIRRALASINSEALNPKPDFLDAINKPVRKSLDGDATFWESLGLPPIADMIFHRLDKSQFTYGTGKMWDLENLRYAFAYALLLD